jgi:uncharacterized membrane protein YphA (DoxX/SURF4 family)
MDLVFPQSLQFSDVALLGIALGVFTQVAALGLSMIMLGAIQKKLFVWRGTTICCS